MEDRSKHRKLTTKTLVSMLKVFKVNNKLQLTKVAVISLLPLNLSNIRQTYVQSLWKKHNINVLKANNQDTRTSINITTSIDIVLVSFFLVLHKFSTRFNTVSKCINRLLIYYKSKDYKKWGHTSMWYNWACAIGSTAY